MEFKKALGLVVLLALLFGVFCVNESEAGGRSGGRSFTTVTT